MVAEPALRRVVVVALRPHGDDLGGGQLEGGANTRSPKSSRARWATLLGIVPRTSRAARPTPTPARSAW
ncbi:hypothetical protein WMF39_11580 [Sorangium sp. So ce1504]|uniref:hypothetical protein n=1 Tax=Sorangium sp. So ce1504 TaxID=3133337 RepID=UPI003F5DD7DE